MAKTSLKVKQQRKTEVFHTCIYQMQDMRKTTFCTEKVRHLPYLLQRTCLQGRDSRCEEGFLVGDVKIAET